MNATATVERLDLTQISLDQNRWARCKVVYRPIFGRDNEDPCLKKAYAVITVLCRTCGPTKIPICRLHLFMVRHIPAIRVCCRKCGEVAGWSGGRSGDRV